MIPELIFFRFEANVKVKRVFHLEGTAANVSLHIRLYLYYNIALTLIYALTVNN